MTARNASSAAKREAKLMAHLAFVADGGFRRSILCAGRRRSRPAREVMCCCVLFAGGINNNPHLAAEEE